MERVPGAGGVGLAAAVQGVGPPMVLVHGSWTDHHGWDAVAPKLATGFRVVRYDRRGHGESDPAGGTLRDDVLDLISLVESLRLAPAHIVGSSRGGAIGLRLAAQRPDLLRSLACHEPPLRALLRPDAGTPEELLSEERAVVALIASGEHEAAARRFVERLAFGPGAWERFPDHVRATFVRNAPTFAEEQRDPDVNAIELGALRRLERPVLLTQGSESPAWFGMVLDRLADVLPRAERHVYRGAGHGPEGSHVGEYVRVVGGFARRSDRI